jgi:hypothetical protein
MFPTNAGGGHGAWFGGIHEPTVGAFEVGQVSLCGERNRGSLSSIFVSEEGFVGEFGQLVVVVRVPHAGHGVQINAHLCTVFHH